MVKKWGTMLALGFVVLGVVASTANAGETDLLIQRLVEKGVLTTNEAQILMDETKQDVAKQNAKGTNEAIPTWIQTTKIKGDTRVRFESLKSKGAKYVNQERLRVRLGVETKVNDQVKVGIGIATGKSTDPRSRNVTLGSSGQDTNSDNDPASPKNIVLDYAFAEYSPAPYATFTAGKFQNPMWNPWDMIWKGDITPEGAALKLNYNVTPDLSVFMNNMFFALRNPGSAGSKNSSLIGLQPGLSWDVTNDVNMKSGLAYYAFTGLKGATKFTYSKGDNTVSNGTYVYSYDALNPSMEIGFKNLLGEAIPYVAVFGDYIYNVSVPKNVTGRGGFDAGVKFGYEKVSDKRQWQMKLATSKLGRNAWIDAFTDSDRYGKGRSNTQSYEGILEYGLGKNTSLGLDFYHSFLLSKGSMGRAPENLLQVDWNLKF